MSRNIRLILPDADATVELGRLVAQAFLSPDAGTPSPTSAIPSRGKERNVLHLSGELGSGKTTFVRGFVKALPGGEEAEVSSPSFTLCHAYPTLPPTIHADLYRLDAVPYLPEDVEEDLEDGAILLLEWPERLTGSARAADRLDIVLEAWPPQPTEEDARAETAAPQITARTENLDILIQPCETKRLADMTAHGGKASLLLERLRPLLTSRFAEPPA